MIQTWPVDLPRPERPSWQMTTQEARQKTQAELGPPRYRRRISKPARLVTMSLLLDRDQRAVFDQFFHVDCDEGTSLFYMPEPTTDGWDLLADDGSLLLDADDQPLLTGGVWLCAWGDQLPVETLLGVEFRKTFSIQVLP